MNHRQRFFTDNKNRVRIISQSGIRKLQKFRESPLQVFAMIRQSRGKIHLDAIGSDRIDKHVSSLNNEATELHLAEIHGLPTKELEAFTEDLREKHRSDHEGAKFR